MSKFQQSSPEAQQGFGLAGSVLGTLNKAKQDSAVERTKSRISEYNAAVARQNAQLARQSAELEAGDIRKNTRRIIGAMKASAAASGVSSIEGSPVTVAIAQAGEGEDDAQRAIFDGAIQAHGFESQAQMDDVEARAYSIRAKQIKRAGYMKAGALIAQGIASGGTGAPGGGLGAASPGTSLLG